MIKDSLYSLLMVLSLGAISLSPAMAEDDDGRDEARAKIDMDPINFNIIRNGRPVGAVVVEIILELQESRDFEDIKARQPFLQSDFLQGLIALSRTRFRVNRPIDPDLVVAYLTPVAAKRLGEGKVSLFVKNAVITPTMRR